MTLALDCPVTLSWLLSDERGAATDALIYQLGRTSAVTPAISPYEVANALLVAQRRACIGGVDLIRVRRALAAASQGLRRAQA